MKYDTDPTTDPVRPGYALCRWATPLLRDPRDIEFVYWASLFAVTVIPSGIYLFVSFHWWHAILHVAFVFYVCIDRYTLMLHNTSHRPLFAKAQALNYFIPCVLGPFLGQSPMTYAGHHIGMHHPEENLWEDLSTTLPYRRDRVLDFAAYFGRFLFLTAFQLPLYLARKKRKMALRTFVGEFGFYIVVGFLLAWRPLPTMMVIGVPFLAMRFLMMMGNWGQHAFIDARDPASPYLSTITCIKSRYNSRCFNDGYHIGHHLKAKMHWTELPIEFEKNRAKYAAEGAVIFEGIDFFMVSLFLLTGQYKTLAKKYVHLGETRPSDDEIIALLKSRMDPVPQPSGQMMSTEAGVIQ